MSKDAEVEKTADGHHVIIKGRKWRATDPSIPAQLESQLTKELMAGRRAVKEHGDAARYRVHDAKVALGERGEPWWEPTEPGRRDRLAAVIRTLVRNRDGKTICPSEAARCVGGDKWRDLMDTSREVAEVLARDGQVEILQRGEAVDLSSRSVAEISGPIRMGPGPRLNGES